MAEHPVVSIFDPATGDTERAELPPHEYMILTGSRREISAMQVYGNGTVQLTLKLLPAGASEETSP